MIAESIINTALSSVTAIIVAIIGVAQFRQSRRTKAIADQTVNHHSGKSNLREDIDTIKNGLVNVQRDIGGLREEQRQTRREVYDQGVYGRDNRHMIHQLEKTLDMRKRGKTNE